MRSSIPNGLHQAAQSFYRPKRLVPHLPQFRKSTDGARAWDSLFSFPLTDLLPIKPSKKSEDFIAKIDISKYGVPVASAMM